MDTWRFWWLVVYVGIGVEVPDEEREELALKSLVLPWVAIVRRVDGSRVMDRDIVSPATIPPP